MAEQVEPQMTFDMPEGQRQQEGAADVSRGEERANRPPTITTTEASQNGDNHGPLPPPHIIEPGEHTPANTDMSSPQRSPFAVDGHNRIVEQTRARTDSQSTTATTNTQPVPKSSLVFVLKSLESIAETKEARKSKKLQDSLRRALTAIKGDDSAHLSPEILFEPLQIASEMQTVAVVTTALDCIGKLISYSYFSLPAESQNEPPDAPPLIERAIDTICDCFQSEATPVETQVQIVKSLLAAILNDKIVVHGQGLLKAVRLIYNIFLLSKNTSNQTLAQTALTQMVDTVFERVKERLALKEARVNMSKTSLEKEEDESEDQAATDLSATAIDGSELNGDHEESEMSETASTAPSDMPVEKRDAPKITLQSFENRKSFDDAKITDAAPTLVTRITNRPHARRAASGENAQEAYEDDEDEIFIKDAYLVFRAMCRLSTKALSVEHVLDPKSQGMRSKLLSLYIIHSLINNHTTVFTSPYATIRSSNGEPTSFVQGIKQYLCLSLSRNGPSSAKQVFEVSLEIYWLMVKFLRVMLKKEVEVFLKEIYFAILEKRAAPAWQKQMILGMLGKLAEDPRALVEIYLNYDCDRTALDNMFERTIEHLSRISTQPVAITAIQQHAFQEQQGRTSDSTTTDWQSRVILKNLSTAAINNKKESDEEFPAEYAMKYEALETLVQVLRSLVNWSQQGVTNMAMNMADIDTRPSADESRDSLDRKDTASITSPHIGSDSPNGFSTPVAEDDPMELDREKQRKRAMANAISTFNFKPKRGVLLLLKGGFIPSDAPVDIARFMLENNDVLNKAMLGEYLGEGEPQNIAIMHSFVDLMDFRQTRFVEALRRFLQSFRLPGEAQKIDRFMLKFAERYIAGNPKAFANADTAYVLAYSVVMLNTDQHSANIGKSKRMTPEDFIKNNRGINDSADLPDDYLRGIYSDIQGNEIILNSERETAANLGMLPQPATTGMVSAIGQAVANASRDLRKEEYAQTEQFANKTELLYKTLLRAQRRGAAKTEVTKFIPASSFKHVGPMFEVTWMPFLTALTGAAQETQNLEMVKLCMEGMKLAIRIACLFDVDSPREAFVNALTKFTNLYNLSEMKTKNLEALKAMLEIAQSEGDLLKGAWRDILMTISQLDRFQLISTGVDEGAVPDVLRRTQGQGRGAAGRRNLNVPKAQRPRAQSANMGYYADIAEESRSAEIVRSVDRIFTNTSQMSGEGILHFVKALTAVSWEEIESSGQSESPRTYSLQKIVEISGYNLTRVRFEWASIWQVLGQHFSQVGCHTNTNVVFFALDSLRQLSMRFLEIEELPGFKFQKDFLKPFEHIIGNSQVVPVKDMALRCLIQMIQARGSNIRSGWRTMFGVFTVAAREPYEGIVNLAYDNVDKIYKDYFGVVITQGAFADLIVCLTQFSKNQKFQKKSLQAIEMLKSTVPKMLRTPECPLSRRAGKARALADGPVALTQQTQEEQFWFPVLFAFHDVLMTGDDLEVRSRALNYLFETLMRYGGDFPLDFWDTLWRQLLYPIFMVLRSKSEMSKFATNEELSIWLSSTMIEALRKMIALFTHFFESLEYMLDRFLELLILCICQENETLARIGSNSLQQLIHENVSKFAPEHWSKIVGAFVELFTRTEATALFSAATSSTYHIKQSSSNGFADLQKSPPGSDTASLSDLPLGTPPSEPDSHRADNALGINGVPSHSLNNITTDPDSPTTPRAPHQQPLEDFHENSLQETPVVVTAARRRFFNQIITKCVLTLLMIETVNELFSNDNVYDKIPSTELLRLMGLLKKSFHFAKKFNNDRDLRTRLFKEGFMKQPPNLLKQESGAASVYVSILFRMFLDTGAERVASRDMTEDALVPLCADIVSSYIELDEVTQQRNIVTWRPVVVDVLEGYSGFPEAEFEKHIPTFAPMLVGLLNREMGNELQRAVQAALGRVLEVRLGLEMGDVGGRGLVTPVSERGSVFGGRRGSRGR